tara:strand:- start:36 stop:284 length:249 start_codon:yes stop_codon:yes gene_type:complete
MKEHKMFIFFLLKISAKKLTVKKINIESVIPNTEFSTMYGENIKKHAPIIAISLLKNLRARKYTGIAVNIEKIIVQILCMNI